MTTPAGPHVAPPLDERLCAAFLDAGLDEADSDTATNAAMTVLRPPSVLLVWCGDAGYQCPQCSLYVCIPKRAGSTCPRCVAPATDGQPS